MEYYVLCVGGKPTKVFTDRVSGLAVLTEGFRLTEKESKAVQKALELGISIGEKVMVVGYEFGKGWLKDRSLTRTE